MKRLFAVAAFLLASSAAQAQYSFQYGGHTIRIDPDRGTVSIPGVYDNTGRKSKRAHTDQDSTHKQQQAPLEAKVDPQAQPQPQQPADAAATPAAPPAAPAPANALPEPAASTANNAPVDTAALPPPPLPAQPAPAPQVPQEAAAPNPPPSPVPAAVAAVPPPVSVPVQRPQAPAPVAAAAPRDPNSPLGVWLTEEKEGKVRIEQCGVNLCGYSVDAKSNQNGEQVLINMKPAKNLKWSGRILDPNTGSTYDSTIALTGSATLRVQGCAFGGMFCGGQTWTRVD
jgi:Uncharacterized protein conserved in bacteria (DUF2147)